MGINKSKSAFRSIAEVTEDLGIAPHVLRFWETKFSQIKPMKTKSSRRYYRPDDVELLALIKELLYERRYTIEGVQKLFKNRSLKDILGTEIQKTSLKMTSLPRSSLQQQRLHRRLCALPPPNCRKSAVN